MTIDLIKEKAAAYPVATASVVVVILSVALSYWRWDVESALVAERDSKNNALQEITMNENNAKSLLRDSQRAKLLHDKVFEKALDFDSTISAQAFFADFVQRAPVKAEGLPVQDSLPTLVQDAKPLAFCSYKTQVTSEFTSLLKFLASFGSHSERAMVVSRVQVAEVDSTQAAGGLLNADISFRLWGRRGDLVPFQAPSDKNVTLSSMRNAKLASVEKYLTPLPVVISSTVNPFGVNLQGAKRDAEKGDAVGLESALNKLKFTIEPFLGTDVVKIPGSSPKRVNNELELKVEGKLEKVKIIAITKDSFTVQSSSGNKIKISLKQ